MSRHRLSKNIIKLSFKGLLYAQVSFESWKRPWKCVILKYVKVKFSISIKALLHFKLLYL